MCQPRRISLRLKVKNLSLTSNESAWAFVSINIWSIQDLVLSIQDLSPGLEQGTWEFPLIMKTIGFFGKT